MRVPPEVTLGIWGMPLAVVVIVLSALARAIVARGGRHIQLLTSRATSWLSITWMPLAIGAVTSALMWWTWGSLDEPPNNVDEAAYLFQARLLASGRWTAPPPPLPEFFEQWHMLVTPVRAAKYFPGHALTLAPGVWLGAPGLVPVLLLGLTGAPLFALTRRLSNGWCALIAWIFWITIPGGMWSPLRLRPSYFSEVTTGAAWLLGWWALLRWRDDTRGRWLAMAAGVIAWGAITRPLTMLMYAVPLAVVVPWMVARRRAWRQLAGAVAAAMLVLAIVPLWSIETTGSWRETPLQRYTRTYIPWDVPGFTFDSTPPLRTLPADMQAAIAYHLPNARSHSLRRTPRLLRERMAVIEQDVWQADHRGGLMLFLFIGLLVAPPAAYVGVAAAAALLLGYLIYPHPAIWTLYYVEMWPVLAFLTAIGIWFVVSAGARGLAGVRDPSWRSVAAPAPTLAAIGLVAITAPTAVSTLGRVRTELQRQHVHRRDFRSLVRAVPARKAIVFIRYGPQHSPHASLIANDPDLASAKVWLVVDRGADNARLIAAAPDRVPFLYDGGRERLVPIAETGAAVPGVVGGADTVAHP